MTIDVAIKSERICVDGKLRPGVILVANGKIVGIEDNWSAKDATVSDVGRHVVMPALVDPHVHINEPGRTEWEGFDSATRAALAGGIGSLVEMPLNASPVTTTKKAFEEKIRAATGNIHCNCGFWGGIVPGNEREILPMIREGILGFKAFLTHSGIDEFPAVGENDLRKVLPLLAEHNLPLLVHAELETISAPNAPTKKYSEYLASRPSQWEDDAIRLLIRLCREYDCHIHIVHLSSADSLRQIADAKAQGLRLTVETAPHYLFFNAEEIGDGRTEFKCAPPIRSRQNNERLWQALRDGLIDFVATDHSPSPPNMKETGGEWMSAWGGIASLQLLIPVTWTRARSEMPDLTCLSKWLCESPAALPSLSTKGKIARGFDADFVVWDPDEKFTVDPSLLHHRHPITPYAGRELYGMVHQTWLNGQVVYERHDSEIGKGKFLHLNKGTILYHD